MRIVVTGGLGFIGSAVVRRLITETDHEVLNIDKQTYAGDPRTVAAVADDARYHFARLDICDGPRVERAFRDFRPDAVLHLAAESHVDRSIDGPAEFITTNLVGTFTLLEAALRWSRRRGSDSPFRFVQASTDEVFGSLGPDDPPFSPTSPYAPRSPYSASKAGADHLARAWGTTYGLPVMVTNCSNNYGPFQFPEKLIPLMIIKGVRGEPLPVYGDGANVRDWLAVEDHAVALIAVLEGGRPGATYAIGGGAERRNIDVVHRICDLLDDRLPGDDRRSLIEFVADRPGHDERYALDTSLIHRELGWAPSRDFETGLERTVDWYLEHRDWWQSFLDGGYGGGRLGARR